ncbi:LysM peptidoglycan-binding domain-containing protein [soil metagenome]|jgi:phage protein U
MTGGSIVRAVLTGADGSILPCQFNPTTLTLAKSSHWQATPTRGAARQPRPQFVGTGPETLSAKLLFDSFDSLGGQGVPVSVAVNQLLEWTCVPTSAYNAATPQPPIVTFRWGTGVSFEGFLKSVNAQYTMFSPDGRPSRATADITLQRTPDDPRGTNPTSGGVSGRRSALVGDADSLASISYDSYGDPNLWRAIASINGIEDPRRVPVGTRLLIPPRSEAVALSSVGDGDV